MVASPEKFVAAHARLIERLYDQALESLPLLRGGLSREEFATALHRSVRGRFGAANPEGNPGAQEISAYMESLHVADLALGTACAAGNEAAWEHFITHFRPELYAAARAVAGESHSRELADSLYADLYGLKERDGQRRSLFEYFHGRSKLSTWLRAILAQRHVDAVRAARRTVSIEEQDSESGESLADTLHSRGKSPLARPASLDPDRARYLAILQAALTTALAALDARERLRLCYYYVQDLTLAQIGRLMNEHEATVSRKLERTRRDLRGQIERALRKEKRLSEAQIQLCYEYAREEWPFDLTKALSSAKGEE